MAMMSGMPDKEKGAIQTKTQAISKALLPALVFFAGYFILNFKSFQDACNRSGDYALILLETLRAARFEALLGPYSRFGFHHPGPIYFYLYALLEPLGCFAWRAQGRLSFVQFLLNAGLLFYALRVVARERNSAVSAAIFWLLILASFYPSRHGILHDIWGPSTLLAPFVSLLVTAAAFAAGRTREFPVMVLSLSLLASNHLGSLPVAGLVAAAACIGWLTLPTRERGGANRAMLLAGAVIGAAAAAPALVDALSRPHGGNLGQMLGFFALGRSAESLGFLSGLRLVASYYSAALRIPAPFLMFAVVVVMTVFMIKSSWSRQIPFIRRLTVLVVVALVSALPAAASIRGKPYQYLMLYLYGLAAVHLFILADWAADKAFGRISGKGKSFLLGASVLSLLALYPYRQNRPRCGDKYDLMMRGIRPAHDELIILKPAENKVWGQMAGLVYRLSADGYRVCVPQRWQFMFGRELACRPGLAQGTPEKRVTITSGGITVESAPQSPTEDSK